MIDIGCHLSISKGFENLALTAVQLKCTTFQCFLRNPRGRKAKNYSPADVERFWNILNQNNFTKFVAHAPYTLNLCSKNQYIRKISRDLLKSDIEIMERFFPGNFYNFHPGSHGGMGEKQGIQYIINGLDAILTESQTTTMLLETMTGKGSEIGGKFEHFRSILNEIKFKDRVAICFDTCHVFDAGYDIVNNLDGILENFDKIIGISKLKFVHLNNSKNSLGSKKDRHEKILNGTIPFDVFEKIVNHKYLKKLPFVLETPHEGTPLQILNGYAEEIKLVKSISH